MTKRTFKGLQISTAMVFAALGWSLPVAAQSLECPMPHTLQSPGVLQETPAQIAETGRLLTSGDGVNRLPEIVAGFRKRYPGISDAEIENYLVAAFCPTAARLDGLSLAERQARVDRFARQARVSVYSH